MVIPTPDENDTVMELLLLRSIKVAAVADVTLSPIVVKFSDSSMLFSLTTNDSLFIPNTTWL